MHLGYHELRNMLDKFKEERNNRKPAPASSAPPLGGGPPRGGGGGGGRDDRERGDRGYDRDRPRGGYECVPARFLCALRYRGAHAVTSQPARQRAVTVPGPRQSTLLNGSDATTRAPRMTQVSAHAFCAAGRRRWTCSASDAQTTTLCTATCIHCGSSRSVVALNR
jgi:hypothetical protein